MKTVLAGTRIALKNILFATDFSPHSNAALPYALAIARQYGAKLYGAHVQAPEDYLFLVPETWPAHVQQEEELQSEAAVRLEQQLQGVPHQILSGAGDVWNVLSGFIAEHDIDLLVIGTHGRTGARRVFMGSVAEKIFRQAACPVLSVGPTVSSRPSGGSAIQHSLFATDFGDESLAALPYAISLAEEDQGQLALLHVVEHPAAGIVDLDAVRSSLMSRLRELVPPEAEPWCHVECLVEFGQQFAAVDEKILEVAKDRSADLIILGARPTRRALSPVTHLARTTAQHIVANAACPVLTLRAA